VSSILKALKKIETTGVSEEPSGQQAPSGLQAMFAPKLGARWYTRRGVLWLLGAMFLAAGAAAYYGWSNGSPPSQTAGVAREVRSPLPPGQTTPPPAKPIPTPPPAPAPRPTEGVDGPAAAAGQPKAAPPVQAPPPSSRIRPRDGGGPTGSETRPPSAQRSAPAARPASGRSPEDSLSRLEESKLKVMAIAWTDDPARRLAVVNGHIVKEGESVEGYNVMQIRKDDIIVNDGGRSWRVELNLKAQP